MAETRTTLTIYPATQDFLDGRRCVADGAAPSKRIALLCARYAAMMEHALQGRDKLTPQEWSALDRAARDVAFNRAEDPMLLPAVVKLAIRRQPAAAAAGGAGSALSSVSYKLDQAAPAVLFAIADVLERWRGAVPDAAQRTAEGFEQRAAELDLAVPEGA